MKVLLAKLFFLTMWVLIVPLAHGASSETFVIDSVKRCEKNCPGCKSCGLLREKLAGNPSKPAEKTAVAKKEIAPPPSDDSQKPSTFHEESGGVANRAAEEKAEHQRELERKEEVARKFREEQIRKAEERARVQEREEAARADAKRKADLEHDRRLIEEAKARLEKDKQVSLDAVRAAKDEKIREDLTMAAIAQQAREEIKRENAKTGLELAQLLQMAAITMQAATAMNSMDGTSPVQSNTQPYDITKPVAPKAALGRSPASFGDKKGTISNKSDGSELADGEKSEGEAKSVKDKETLAKIKAEVEAAEKRKKIQAMRLKQKLRDKLRAQGKDGAVDTDELFGGSLNQGMEGANADDATEESAAKDSGMSASNIYQAVREGFSLAGAETDREVGELVSEVERDLSSEDMSAGVLGRESPSLFARVRAVHQACQRDKCVLVDARSK